MVSLLFGFKGRINRAQFWLGNIGVGVAGMMLFFMLGLMFAPQQDIAKTDNGVLQMLSLMGLTMGPVMMLMGWCGLALQTKRFHDRGRSGLWTLLPLLPLTMILMEIVIAVSNGDDAGRAFGSVSIWLIVLQLVNLFMFVDLGCMPSKQGPNKYGDPPGSGTAPAGAPGGPANKQVAGVMPSMPGMGAGMAAGAATGAGGGLTGAESAIERAIAARAKQTQAQPQPQRAAGAAAPAAPLRPAAAGSFGRKVTQ